MNLAACFVPYFSASDSLLHHSFRATLLADIRRQRSRRVGVNRSFILPSHWPYEQLSLKALVVLLYLFHDSYYSRTPFSIETKIVLLAGQVKFSRKHAELALRELQAHSLVRYETARGKGTKILLTHPDSGLPLSELAASNLEVFNSRPAWEWYDLFLYRGQGVVTNPDFYDHRNQVPCDKSAPRMYACPLQRQDYEDGSVTPCNGLLNATRNKLQLTFFKSPHEWLKRDGRWVFVPSDKGDLDHWHCFRCGRGGTCWDLWRRLYPRWQRQREQQPTICVVGMPVETERQKEWREWNSK